MSESSAEQHDKSVNECRFCSYILPNLEHGVGNQECISCQKLRMIFIYEIPHAMVTSIPCIAFAAK
jgi:hypothetical protein